MRGSHVAARRFSQTGKIKKTKKKKAKQPWISAFGRGRRDESAGRHGGDGSPRDSFITDAVASTFGVARTCCRRRALICRLASPLMMTERSGGGVGWGAGGGM